MKEIFTREFVEREMRLWNIPGAAVAVCHGGEVFSEGYGYRNVEKKEEMTPDTLMGIASCYEQWDISGETSFFRKGYEGDAQRCHAYVYISMGI